MLAQDGREDLPLEDVDQLLFGPLEILAGPPPGEEAASGPAAVSASHLSREIVGLDQPAAAENGGPLHGVGQLTDVPRPRVGEEQALRLG